MFFDEGLIASYEVGTAAACPAPVPHFEAAAYEHDPNRDAAIAAAEDAVLTTFERLAEFSPDIAQALRWIRLGDDERVAELGGGALFGALADPDAVLEFGPGLSNVRVLRDALHQAAQLAAQDYDKRFRL
ncbi:MAG TPA: hypothetical protein VLG11_03850 [Candidatus Saccharimonadales bacterium]|nr:hypothetical protein [Candidatus Saccharimonadales bacterium]